MMNICYMHTPIGYLKICESENLITEITYCGSCPEADCGSSAVLEKAKKQLQEYFDGSRKTFDLPLDINGSPFTVGVLNALAATASWHKLWADPARQGRWAPLCAKTNLS